MVSVGVAMSLLVVLLRCAVASKEQIDPDTQAAVESIMKSNLWQQIRKRLQDAGIPSEEIDGLEDVKESQSQDSCNFDYEEGIIIRTHDSISSGATFIGAPDVTTKNQCSELCCKSQTCNTAVFKNKDEDNSCYLFDCGTPNVCKFTNHPGYIIARLPKRHTSNKLQEKHEVDLESLAETTTTTTTTTTTSTTTTPTTTTSAPEPKQPVPLFGKCSSHKDCAGSMSACQAGYCVCQDGFHAQEGVCRKDCGKFEFECANEGHPSSYPQCIAIYDHCDDIIHCNDGSDEKHCKGQNGYEDKKNGNPYDNQGKPRASTGRDGSAPGGTHVISHPSPDDEQPSSELPAQRPSPPSSRQHVQRPSPPSNRRPPATAKQQPEDTPKLTPASEPVQEQPVRQQQPKDKSHQQPQEKNDDVKDKEKNNPEEDKDSKESERSDSQSKSSESVELDSKPAKPDIPSKEPEVDNPHVPPVDSSSTLAIIKTKIEKVVMPTSTKGAVVALALGLAITAMLLVFVGCRLRNVKHRLRRGRPMNTNEADYLVNGMYL